MTSRRKALVVGCGLIGQIHARLLGERSDVEVWACDPVEDNLREVQENAAIGKTFSDYDIALQERPDLVWVCTPNRFHAPIAIAAMEVGADVLCEKPLADTLEAGQAIANAVETTGRTLMVGYTLRWYPGFQFNHQAIDEGRFGTVVGGCTRLHGGNALRCSRSDYRRHEKAALLLDFSHEIDYMRWFFGDVVEVKAIAATIGHCEPMISPNIVEAILRFADGRIASVHLDYVQPPGNYREVEIFADGGMIRYNTNEDHLSFYVGKMSKIDLFAGQGKDWAKVYARPADVNDPLRAEIQTFLDAVDGKCPPPVSVYDGLAVLKILFTIIASYEEK